MQQQQLWVIAAITAVALIAVAYIVNSNAPSAATALDAAIKLASEVVGFGVAVYGGIKAFTGLSSASINAYEVGAASATSAAGALLLLASQL